MHIAIFGPHGKMLIPPRSRFSENLVKCICTWRANTRRFCLCQILSFFEFFEFFEFFSFFEFLAFFTYVFINGHFLIPASPNMPRRTHKQRNRRAITDMTASYTPLRDLGAVPEEVRVAFVTVEKTEHSATICVGHDQIGVLQVTMWVQGSTDLHHVIFCAKDCLWCRDSEVEVLFWKRPILTMDVALRFRFESAVDTHNFMRRVVR